jgi:hypothetical protein
MCEKLRSFPEILSLLEQHEIGYHSTSHSVHPNIFEYTDIENYEAAYHISLRREQSRINPLTGEIEGQGGFLLLKDSFPNKKIVAFRAPGFCWSPPHLEALEKLGIRFDFSTCLSRIPVRYKKITFYPYPIGGYRFPSMRLGGSLLMFGYAVLMAHPRSLVYADWDAIYRTGNPKRIYPVKIKSGKEMNDSARVRLKSFESFLKTASYCAKKGMLQITPQLQEGIHKTRFTKKDVLRSYRRGIDWAEKFFNYKPKFLLAHFFRYFNLESELAEDESRLCQAKDHYQVELGLSGDNASK